MKIGVLAAILFSGLLCFGCARSVTERTGDEKRGKPSSIHRETKPLDGASLNRDYIGTWLISGSSSEFQIRLKKGRVTMRGWDYKDNEKYTISGLRWDGSVLRATLLMPSTKHRTHVRLSVLDQDTIQCAYTGDNSGHVIWKRKRER
jgi:hypothetical protein